jgi:hypothetical protein
MNIPVETKPAVGGAIVGAVAVAIAGFSWGGWTTGARAEAVAVQRSNDAVVVALAPICAERFQHATGATTNLAELKKVDAWSRGDFVEKGGWATTPGPGSADQLSAVAKACAVLIAG